MFARVSRFKLRPGAREDATRMMEGMEEKIMALRGMVSFTAMVNSDREGLITVVAESELVWTTNAAQTAHLWSNFAQYLEAIPTHTNYDTVANWSKQ